MIGTDSNTVIATINVGVQPNGVSITPDGTEAYVANYGSNSVSVIDILTKTVKTTVSVGGNPVAFGAFIGRPPQPTSSLPLPVTIQNSANQTTGAIAPGEFITIKGYNLGPATPASFTLNSQGSVDSILAGVQVMFDSFPGTPTYVSATQINVAVPYEIAGRTSTNLSVLYQGAQSAPTSIQVVPAMPSIFTFNATGQGQAVSANVTGPTAGTDNGPASGVVIGGITLPSSPATQGSFISVYATGCGMTSPPGVTGSVNSITTEMPLAKWTPTSGTVIAMIGDVPAQVSFAGAALGLVTGVYQFDIQVPAGVSGDALPLLIFINGPPTFPGATIAVQ